MRFVGIDDRYSVKFDDRYRHRELEQPALSKSTPCTPSAPGTANGSGIAASRDAGQAKDSVAVALQSDPDQPGAIPRVVATGRGEFAEIILDIAFRSGVKVRRDVDLAEILATVDLDSEIPVEAIIAVAEILRYVYAANQTGPREPEGSASPVL